MKRNVRLLALLACLLITALVFAVPAFAMADAADETTGAADGAADAVTDGVTDGEEATGAIDISFNITRFVDSLQYMWKGMLCIFIVIGAIILSIYGLNKAMNAIEAKKKNESESEN